MRFKNLAIKRLLAGASTVAIIGFAGLGTAQGQTLNDALSLAYATNPTLQSARALLRVRDELRPQAVSAWRPTVTVTGETGVGYSQALTEGGAEDRNYPRSATLSLSQPIFRGGTNFANLSRAENLVLEQRANLANSEQTVLFNTVESYMNVLRDQAILELRINNEQVLQRQLEATQDRFEVGENTRTDVAQAQSRLAQATAQRIDAQGDLNAARATYEEVVGELPGTLEEPNETLFLPESLVESQDLASAQNPSVIAAKFSEEAAKDQVDAVFGDLLPQVSVDGTASYSDDQSLTSAEAGSASLVGRLQIPLYQSGAEYSRVREAKQTAVQERIEVDRLRRDSIESATRAWEALKSAEAQIVSFIAQVEATDIALEGVRQENLVGARTVLDVLDAEQEFLDAQVDLVVATRDKVVAQYQLLQSVGRLNAVDLKLPVDMYDDTENYEAVRGKWFGTGINE